HSRLKRNEKMTFKSLQRTAGFTLGELLVSVSVASIVLAAAVASSVSLQKSFSAADNYFATHMQQVRIVDYLSRDVNRGFSVTTSASSTDHLFPQTTDVELANTEYARTAVTFMPTFTMSGSAAARAGTSMYGIAYLRNKRRG